MNAKETVDELLDAFSMISMLYDGKQTIGSSQNFLSSYSLVLRTFVVNLFYCNLAFTSPIPDFLSRFITFSLHIYTR
jgi:hypothetical protein